MNDRLTRVLVASLVVLTWLFIVGTIFRFVEYVR